MRPTVSGLFLGQLLPRDSELHVPWIYVHILLESHVPMSGQAVGPPRSSFPRSKSNHSIVLEVFDILDVPADHLRIHTAQPPRYYFNPGGYVP